MAMITCPECGKEISSRAKACPHCGNPMDYTPVSPEVEEPGGIGEWTVISSTPNDTSSDKGTRSKKKRGCLTAILVVFGILLLILIVGLVADSDDADGAKPEITTSQAITSDTSEAADTVEVVEYQDTELKESDFEQITVVDNDKCSIIITDAYSSTLWGYIVTASFENKSSDSTYMFSVDDAYVDGVQADPFWATEVTPGKTANSQIIFDTVWPGYDIDDYTDIEIFFHVYDTNDWDAPDVAYETVHVYPNGEENATEYVRESLDTDIVLVDNEYVTATITESGTDLYYGSDYGFTLFLENHSDAEVMFSIDGASINQIMSDPYWATDVAAGKSAFSSVCWYDIEADGISSDISEIEFTFTAHNDDTWDDYADELIVLTP